MALKFFFSKPIGRETAEEVARREEAEREEEARRLICESQQQLSATEQLKNCLRQTDLQAEYINQILEKKIRVSTRLRGTLGVWSKNIWVTVLAVRVEDGTILVLELSGEICSSRWIKFDTLKKYKGWYTKFMSDDLTGLEVELL